MIFKNFILPLFLIFPLLNVPLKAEEIKDVGYWVKQLGAEGFRTRKKAMKEILKLGYKARSKIKPYLKDEDPEIASSAQALWNKLEWLIFPDGVEDVKIIIQSLESENNGYPSTEAIKSWKKLCNKHEAKSIKLILYALEKNLNPSYFMGGYFMADIPENIIKVLKNLPAEQKKELVNWSLSSTNYWEHNQKKLAFVILKEVFDKKGFFALICKHYLNLYDNRTITNLNNYLKKLNVKELQEVLASLKEIIAKNKSVGIQVLLQFSKQKQCPDEFLSYLINNISSNYASQTNRILKELHERGENDLTKAVFGNKKLKKDAGSTIYKILSNVEPVEVKNKAILKGIHNTKDFKSLNSIIQVLQGLSSEHLLLALQKAYKLDEVKKNSSTSLNLANQLNLHGKYKEAAILYKAVISSGDYSAGGYAETLNNIVQELQVISKLPAALQKSLSLGIKYELKQNWQKARVIHLKNIKKVPLIADYLYKLAYSAINNNDLELMTEVLQKIIKLPIPKSLSYLTSFTNMSCYAGNYDLAMKAADSALEQEESMSAHILKAKVFEFKGEFKKSLEYLKKNIKKNDYSANLAFGIAYMENGDFANAEKYLTLVAQEYKSEVEQILLVICRRMQKKPNGKELKIYLNVHDTKQWFYQILLFADSQLTAVQLLEKANSEQNPQQKNAKLCEVNYYISQFKLAEGKKEEALKYLEISKSKKVTYYLEDNWSKASIKLIQKK